MLAAVGFASAQEHSSQTIDRTIGFSLRVRNSLTGLAVPAAELAVRSPAGPAVLEPGKQELLVHAPGYRALSLPGILLESAPAGATMPLEPTTVWLDPETPPAELARASVASRLLPGTALFHGHVVDGRTLEPLAQVEVRLESGGLTTQTDERGYFSLNALGARPADNPDALPPTDDLVFEAPGYKLYRLAHVALVESDTHFVVDMEPGAGETGRDDAHKLLGRLAPSREAPGPEAELPIDGASALAGPAGSEALVVDPVDTIKVQGYGYMSLETYVGNGLNDEWIASWSMDALRAGAVPYRSYGTWYQINRGSICATASCQVYDSDYSTNAHLAAQYTSGILLEKGGAIARSEYSAENNCSRCASRSCANSDLSCGQGWAGSPAAGWPCLADAHNFGAGPGSCCFGHGRGMCQWGSQAWAQTGMSWAWMINHYYNDRGGGTGQRTMFMTSPLTVVAASASPSSLPAGSSFTVNATGRNYAEHAHTQILLRTRLSGIPGSVANGAGDRNVTLHAKTDSVLAVAFTVPATAAAGTYDLVAELWHDVNENGAVEDVDLSLAVQTFPAAVTITGDSGCLASAVPADRWRGEYFANRLLSGTPSLVHDDAAGSLAFDWGTGSPSSACGIGADNFSARWTRTVSLAAGSYRFDTRTDDGVRLYIDDALKIDHWVDRAAPAVPDSVEVTLVAGNHTLRMEFYENGGLASAELSWQPIADPCMASVPSDRWKGEYFANRFLSGTPAMVRDDGAAGLSFNWNTDSPASTCGIGADNFSARWTRTVSLAAGSYRFDTRTDDGMRLFIDDALKIDHWVDRAAPAVPDSVDVTLGAGNHTLRMEFYENGGLASAELSWQGVTATLPPDFDAASSATAETADLAWPHAVAGSDRLLLVGASIRGNVPIASITYAGLSLTKIRHDSFGSDVRSELWYLVGPPVGTANVSVHLSSAQNVIAGATSWTNVDQTSPLGNHAGANHGGSAGTTASVQVASAADQVVVDVVATQASGATVSAGPLQTVRWNRPGNHGNGAESSEPGAATTTLSWALPYPEFWTLSAVALKPSPPSESADRIERRVVVLSYDPVNPGNPAQRLSDYLGTGDVFAHSGRIADAIRAASGRMVDYQIVETHRSDEFPVLRDGFRYTWDSYLACRANVANCHSPDDASYVPILNGEDAGTDLCARIGAGEIDEVWLWGFGWFGFDEFAYKIPNDQPIFQPRPYNYWIYDGRKRDLPVCGRTYFVMGYNHERQEGRGLHSFGHRMESALTASPASQGLWHRCGSPEGSSDWTDFTCIELNGPGRAGCGDVHFPPNGTQGYDYANLTPVTSQCDDWFNYPNRTGATTTVNYATWGGTPWGSDEDGYLTWWMNHVPRKSGSSNRGGTLVENNWWHYILCYDQPCPMTTW